ncbi:MAG: YfcC family protein [Bacteroidales bacterium]|nr:YfcC family protein [Bacteroidales bacterium]
MKRIPHTYVIIFALIVLSAIATWVIPAAKVQTWQIFAAFFNGFSKAPSVIAFILIIGGAFWILNETKAIEYGVDKLIQQGKKWEKYNILRKIGVNNLIIAAVMTLFSLFGAVFGMSEETIAFVMVMIPLSKRMGYDETVGVCMCFLAAGLGFAGCLLNPFTLGIAQQIAGIKMFSGIEYRFFIWLIFTFCGIAFVLHYAHKTEKSNRTNHVCKDYENTQSLQINTRIAKYSLFVLGLVILTLIIGVTVFKWEFIEIAALFFAMAVIIGIISGKNANEIAKSFIDGCKDMLSAAMVVALASGIIVILEDGGIIQMILDGITGSLGNKSKISTLSAMYLFQTLMNALITSGTAKAAMLMPIFRDISNAVGLSLQSTVTAFHIGDGFTNLITPTSGVLIAVLGVAKIPYAQWIKFIWKFILLMIILGWLLLLPTLFLSLPGF